MACCLVEVEACHLGEVVWHQEVEVAYCLEVVGACHLVEEVWRRAAVY